MNVLVFTNNECISARIASFIKKTTMSACLYQCADIQEALTISAKLPVNLFIIDLDTDTGYDFINSMRSMEQYAMTWLIVIASDDRGMAESFRKYHCFTYFVKPVEYQDLIRDIQHLSRYSVTTKRNDYLTLSSKGTNHRIAIDSIKYIEVNLKQLKITTEQARYELDRYPLAKVKNLLPRDGFIQCHRSFIVNKACVNTVHCTAANPFLLVGGDCIPIGNTYVSTMKGLFTPAR